MTFDEWLDEPQTVTTRRERLEYFMSKDLVADHYQRERLMGWLLGAWNAGVENQIPVPRDEFGNRLDTKEQ